MFRKTLASLFGLAATASVAAAQPAAVGSPAAVVTPAAVAGPVAQDGLPYSVVRELVASGHRLSIAVGVPPGPGVIAVTEVPDGVPAGTYRCFSVDGVPKMEAVGAAVSPPQPPPVRQPLLQYSPLPNLQSLLGRLPQNCVGPV